MQRVCRQIACVAMACATVHAATQEEICGRLEMGLGEQVRLLSGMTDASSAASALPALQKNVSELASLREAGDTSALWLYIENAPEKKQALMILIQQLSREFARLEKVRFYGNEGLQALFASQLKPCGDPS